MATFDSTVGGAAATSLIPVATATDYFSVTPSASWWASLALADQQAYLMQGTMRLEQERYLGQQVAPETQALQWPRTGCRDKNGVAIAETVVPKEMGFALCEVIAQYKRLADAGTDPRAPNDLSQFTAVSVGDVSVDIAGADAAPVTDALPIAARRWIGHLLATGSMFGRVVR